VNLKEKRVAEGHKGQIGPIDVRTIRYLAALMSRHDLTEIDVHEGVMRVRLRRGGIAGVGEPRVVMTPQPVVSPASPAATPAAAAAPTAPAKKYLEIKSPTPGTFYAASSPEAEPFVKVGSRISHDTVVCLIEAMKVFNEIPAECAGTIVEVCMNNQQPVEYGQVLFRVDPG
jgi:acetyl-CoA carboxylase biotin carboxyl carrier protein